MNGGPGLNQGSRNSPFASFPRPVWVMFFQNEGFRGSDEIVYPSRSFADLLQLFCQLHEITVKRPFTFILWMCSVDLDYVKPLGFCSALEAYRSPKWPEIHPLPGTASTPADIAVLMAHLHCAGLGAAILINTFNRRLSPQDIHKIVTVI